MLRTHKLNELNAKNDGEKVVLSGWVFRRRDHGGVIFIDLRDRYGLTQIVFNPKHNKESHEIANKLGREYVIAVKGKVKLRGKDLENPKLKTGQIEVIISDIEIFRIAILQITNKLADAIFV